MITSDHSRGIFTIRDRTLAISAVNSLFTYGVRWTRTESACGYANLLASLSNRYLSMRLILVVPERQFQFYVRKSEQLWPSVFIECEWCQSLSNAVFGPVLWVLWQNRCSGLNWTYSSVLNVFLVQFHSIRTLN